MCNLCNKLSCCAHILVYLLLFIETSLMAMSMIEFCYIFVIDSVYSFIRVYVNVINMQAYTFSMK